MTGDESDVLPIRILVLVTDVVDLPTRFRGFVHSQQQGVSDVARITASFEHAAERNDEALAAIEYPAHDAPVGICRRVGAIERRVAEIRSVVVTFAVRTHDGLFRHPHQVIEFRS